MKKSIKHLLFILADLVLIVFVFFGVLTVAEYRPEEIESVEYQAPIKSATDLAERFDNKDALHFISWNLGYAGLGEKQDFFMDGGKMVRPDSIDLVKENLDGITNFIQSKNADFWFFQEVDENSKRTYGINEREHLANSTNFGSAHAYNFECFYVPFPIPTIGKVMSGVASFSPHEMYDAKRISLPVPFSWPMRVANMKRCLLVSRVSLGEGKPELVLVNLHLEAYDDGEGKIAQTKVLMDMLETEYKKGNYVIAGGDFNQIFPGTDLNRYPQDAQHWAPGKLLTESLPATDWSYISDDTSPTCRSLHAPFINRDKDNWQYYVIDGFIVSPNVEVLKAKTINLGFKHSDHNPVEMSVILK